MSVVRRWTGRLRVREGLLKAARARLAYRKTKHAYYHSAAAKRAYRGRDAERVALATKWHKRVDEARADVDTRELQVAFAKRVLARHRGDDHLWGGSRAVTNRIVEIVGNRAEMSSRKRTETFGNPDSDHHVSQKTADAVDFRIAEAHWLKNEVSRKLGGPSELPDYGSFNVREGGKTYRVQGIAGTHGTGPHLHFGVRLVG